MRLTEWRDRGTTETILDRSIFVIDEGSGPSLLLIHGFPTSSYDWYRIWEALVERSRTVAFDLLGYGFSDRPFPHDYTIAEQTDLTIGLVEARRLDGPIDLLAHDYGVTVAQEILARNREGRLPFALRSVTFVNGGLFPEATRPRIIQRLLAGPIGSLLARFVDERRFRKSLAAVFGPRTRPSEEELADFWELVAAGPGTALAPLLLRYIDERKRHRSRWVGALQDTTVPLRLINGPADPVSGRPTAERFRELISEPDVVLLPDDIGHFPQLEAPETVLAAVNEQLGRVRDSG